MLSRLVCGKAVLNATLLKSAVQNVSGSSRNQVFKLNVRKYATEGGGFRTRAERIAERQTLKEKAMSPPGNYRFKLEIIPIFLF